MKQFKRCKTTRCRVALFTALMLLFSFSAIYAQPPKIQISQVRNGTVGNSTVNWVTGNVGAQNSHYVEGYSVPYRAVMENMPAGQVTLVIGFDVKHSGKHALDFLTTYQNMDYPYTHQEVFGHASETIDPTVGYSPGAVMTTWPTPQPTTTPPGGTWTEYDLEALNYFTLWGGTLISANYVTEGDLTQAQSEAQVEVIFNVDNPGDVILAWGGRIGSQDTWGVGNSAVNINGSPYHMRLIDWSLGNIGQQDLSLNAGAVSDLPPCDFSGDFEICAEETAQYTYNHTPDPTWTLLWSLENINSTGAAIIGSNTGTSIDVYVGSGGSYDVRLAVTKPFQDGTITSNCVAVVTVNPLPVFNLPDPPADVCPSEVLSWTGPTPPTGTTYSYYWEITDGDGTILGSGMSGTSVISSKYSTSDNIILNVDQTIQVQAGADCSGYYVLQLTVTDNTTGCEYTDDVYVAFGDDDAPSWTFFPDDITIGLDASCSYDTSPSNTGMPTAVDDCASSVTITYTDTDITSGTCKTIERAWKAEDSCGNYIITNQTITVVDPEAPVISCPPDVTVECDESTDPSNTGEATATDNCTVTSITYSDNTTAGGCPQEYTITRTWTATDDCGNNSQCTQVITVQDTEAPILSGVPGDVTVECDAVPNPPTVTATDNCDDVVPVVYAEVRTDGNCDDNYTLTRTWTATDDCGNATTGTQVITVEDTTPPVITCPDDQTIYVDATCYADTTVGTNGSATATDNCDNDVTITYSDVVTQLAPPCMDYEVERTWVATDNCGNSSSCVQTLTVLDEIDPVISCPADVTLYLDASCSVDDQPPATGVATATDNCDNDVTITWSDVVDQLDPDCADYEITRTWTATDDCDNSSTCVQVITVLDNTAPVITCPDDLTLYLDASCSVDDQPPATGVATATDNCDNDVTITWSDVVDQLDPDCADYEITRTWTATDDCDNSSTCVQIITVEDNTPPTLIGVPADITVECDAVPAPATVTATDNCDGTVPVSFTETQTAGTCPDNYTLTRTWTATDNCGNATTETQVITVEDTTPPVIEYSGPTYIEAFCGNLIYLDPVTASDNCDDDVTINCTRVDPPGMDPKDCDDPEFYEGTTTLTYVAVDDCGNESDPLVITVYVISPVPCEIERPEQDPFCNMLGNKAWAGPNTKAGAASFEWYFDQTSIDNGWEITYGTYTDSINYTSGTGTGVLYLSFVDTNDCPRECYVEIECIPAWDNCTMTQGFYGNAGGTFCTGQGTWDLLDSLFIANGGTLVVGSNPGGSLTIDGSDPANCVINLLPGGGPAKSIAPDDETCATIGPPLINPHTGRLKNILLAQTITLSLNSWLTPDLGTMPIESEILTIAPTMGCGPYDFGYSINDFTYYQFPSDLLTELIDEYGDPPTIANLLDYANRAIHGETLDVSLDEIVEGVSLINEAFDECKAGTFDGGYVPPYFNSLIADSPTGGSVIKNAVDELELAVFPNPFSSKTFIEFTVPETEKATLEVYTVTGVKLATLFEATAEANIKYTVEFSGSSHLRQEIYVYVLRTSTQVKHGRIIMIR